MGMTSRLVACASFACAVAFGACGAGTAGPPSPSDPFGTDPAGNSGYEQPGGGGDMGPAPGGSIEQICAYDCNRFEMICPGSEGGTDCAASCAQAASSIPGCEAQFRAYLACVGTAPATCNGGSLSISGCDAEISAINSCESGPPTGSGGTGGGGTGSAGASGGSL